MTYPQLLEHVLRGHDLTADDMTAIMEQLMTGQLTPAQIGAFLIALRRKSESVTEITAAARTLRRHATAIDPGPAPVVDTCGTGGDGKHTANISTAAALIAAGAGVKVAKHGNRSVSSRSGSADVMAALGVNTQATPAQISRCLQEGGFGFLFAPLLHGAMKHVAGIRRELGVRTLFNMLGPLSNPAGADRQLIGVFNPDLTPVYAGVLRELGLVRALVVHGHDGTDELTTTTTSQVTELRDGQITTTTFDPQPLLGAYAAPDDLIGGDPEANAAILRAILANQPGPHADVAALNAGAVIYLAGRATTIADGFALARQTLANGQAQAALDRLVRLSHEPA